MVDIGKVGESRVMGSFPPVGIRQRAVQPRVAPRFSVLSGKGLTSMANPRGANPGIPGGEGQYSGSILEGSLSTLPTPSADALAPTRRPCTV